MSRAFLLITLLPAALAAQTADRPPAFEDSVAALIQDPADHRGEDFVILLEDGLTRVDAEGTWTTTTRQVVQVLTADGAAYWGEMAFSFDPDRHDLHLDWMRVLEDGEVVREGPEHQQESSRAVQQGAPVYDETRVVQATLAGVRPGTVVDYRVTLQNHDPWLPADFFRTWNLNGTAPVVRSRFRIDVPDSMQISTLVTGQDVAPVERVESGRRVITWTRRDSEAIEPELFAAFPNDVFRSVRVAGPHDWESLGSWYSRFIEPDYPLGESLVDAHDRELRGAAALRDSLAHTYRWVAQDFRYVSLALGDGGYRPRAPQDVYETGFGDCKDKTTLFIALARRLGARAYPVLVAADGGIAPELPSLGQFDHMIAAVEVDGTTLFVDPTTTLIPFGEIPPALQGEPGLAVHPDGSSELITLPASDPDENRFRVSVTGTVDEENRFSGALTMAATGTEQYSLRDIFAGFPDKNPQDRGEILRQFAETVYEGAVVDSSRTFDGLDLEAAAEFTIWFSVDELVGSVGNRLLLYLPIDGFADPSALTTLAADSSREFPIDVAQVNSPSIYTYSAEMELPPRWRVEVPAAVSLDGPFGYYEAEFEQSARTLSMRREMGGLRGTKPARRLPELMEWLQGVSSDDAEYVLIDPLGPVAADPEEEAAFVARVLPTLRDLGDDAVLLGDGAASALGISSNELGRPIRSHVHEFGAEEIVFTVGDSRLMLLSVAALEYETAEEARQNLAMNDIIDSHALAGRVFELMGEGQISLAEVRPIELPDLPVDGRAWLMEIETPMSRIRVVNGVMAHGRVSLSLFALGPDALRADDVRGLMNAMGDRVRSERDVLVDMEPSEATHEGVSGEAVAMAAGGVPLHTFLPTAAEMSGIGVVSDELTRLDYTWVEVTRTLTARALTFPLGEDSRPMKLRVRVARTEAAGWPIRYVLQARAASGEDFADAMGAEPVLGVLTAAEQRPDFDQRNGPDLGVPSISAFQEIREGARVDEAVTMFGVGPYLVRMQATAPAEQLRMEDVHAVARLVYGKIMSADPDASEFTVDEAVIERVERVLEVEEEAEQLMRDREFGELLELIDEERIGGGIISFRPWLWNEICWWGALHFYAERLTEACEAAVAPDPSNVSRRDSRGLVRALNGDIEGAIADFEYVVEHGSEQLRTTRAPWVEALRAGKNPFTRDVLIALRDE